MDKLITRLAEARLDQLMRVFRVVVVNGPRQAGKTTLLQMYAERHGGEMRWTCLRRSSGTASIVLADAPGIAGSGGRPPHCISCSGGKRDLASYSGGSAR